MIKKFIKRLIPTIHSIRRIKGVSIFNHWLDHANLWCLNRRSVSGAIAVGLFVAFIPLPCQMLISAAVAIFFQVNLPLSISLVWLTNPLTMPIIFYATYLLGSYIIQKITQQPYVSTFSWNDVNFSWSWLIDNRHFFADFVKKILIPFLLGNFLCGLIMSILGYYGSRLFWRYSVIRQWHLRKNTRLKKLRIEIKK